ncbi:MAG: NTP transferase domain-containing protein [Candidatus Delongbacteria bacterium]|nr:NTP transferase domain-containing protein [Candidatus Delongbacteria bacterium]
MDRHVDRYLSDLSGNLDMDNPRLAVILAAGHGKRIKSEKSKMLHEIWGKSTIERVTHAVETGLNTDNIVFVLGIKAEDVLESIPKKANYLFIYQSEQLGTGHAVKIAFDHPQLQQYQGRIYIFPGDIGLLTGELVAEFADGFENSQDDMMVLTADYEGETELNYYGRIIRVSEQDRDHLIMEPELVDKVIAIKEYKDINALNDDQFMDFSYNSHCFRFSKSNLLEIPEFNTSILAFRSDHLPDYLQLIRSNNVQQEIYLTDLIEIYNQHQRKVGAYKISDLSQVLGFNNKSVLKQMEHIYRTKVYDQLKDIIMIDNNELFFIADEVVKQIIEMDRTMGPLDISIGMNVHIGPEVRLNRRVRIENNCILAGRIEVGEGVQIGEHTMISAYPGQMVRIGDRCNLIGNDRIKGQVSLDHDCRIESGVRITGSLENPVQIGSNVLIKGTTYIYGCRIDPGILIEHSILRLKHIEAITRKDGTIQPVRYILPVPQGIDSLRDL